MFVLRSQPKGARFALFGLGLCVFALMPTEIGYQDIASLLARQPGVAERWQKRVFSAAGTIQVATFSFGRPIGTFSPQTATYRLTSLDNQGIDITGSIGAQFADRAAAALSRRRFPQGRSYAEGRPPGRAAAVDGNRGAHRTRAGNRGSRDIEWIGQGRQDRRAGAFRRACAARSGTAGRAERAAAGALRCVIVARSQAAGRSQDRTGDARGRR